MIKLTIVQSDEYSNYILKDVDGKNYSLNINFIGIEKPKVGDSIYIQESVIKEDVSLNYGLVDEENKPSEDELIILNNNKEDRYLQRFYG